MLRIFGKAASINVRKVLWTCAELDIAFVREDWGAGYESTSQPGFLAMNPNAMVPVIRDGNFVLWESNTICRYLCGMADNQQLLPLAPHPRALVEQWMDWQATELNAAWRYAFMALVRASPAHRDSAQIEASIAAWHRHMGILERQLETTGYYVAGDKFSLADVVVGLSVHRWVAMPIKRPSYPAICDYYKCLSKRPGFTAYGVNGGP